MEIKKEELVMPNMESYPLNFPNRSMEGETREIVILEFDHQITVDEAIAVARNQGLVYTTYEDVSRFGVEYPDMRRENPAVFLHEGFTDSFDFPYRICLGHDGNQRIHIGFEHYGGRDHRFAFTRVKK